MMTTATDANVHALAVEGTFDDCQAIVKGLFNHHAFRDRVRLSGVNSINWARIVAQVVYYFTAAVALGAPHRKVAFTVPTGNFGDIFAGYVAAAHGAADRPAGDRHQRQRHPGAHARDRHLRGARRRARPSSPSMDIQVSSNFERLLFEAYRPRRRRGARADGVARPVAAASRCRSHALARDPRAVHRRSRRRGRDRRDHPHRAARDRLPGRSAYRGGACGRREGNARSGDADGRARDRASGEIPRCGRGRLRRPPGTCRTGSPTSPERPERVDRRCRPIRPRSKNSSWRRAVPRAKEPRHER